MRFRLAPAARHELRHVGRGNGCAGSHRRGAGGADHTGLPRPVERRQREGAGTRASRPRSRNFQGETYPRRNHRGLLGCKPVSPAEAGQIRRPRSACRRHLYGCRRTGSRRRLGCLGVDRDGRARSVCRPFPRKGPGGILERTARALGLQFCPKRPGEPCARRIHAQR